jgi:hypothetical protein
MGESVNNRDWQEDVKRWILFCKQQIDIHQNTIRKLKGYSWLEILTGIGLTVLAFIYVRSDTAKFVDTFFKLGPMLVFAPFPAFQYRMILGSRQSISIYEFWKDELQNALVKNVYPESLIKELTDNRGALAKPR